MKLIVAMIRPEMLGPVRAALEERDVMLMCAGLVNDLRHTQTARYRGVQYRTSQARMRIEALVVNEMLVPEIVATINRTASAPGVPFGESGDILVGQFDEWVAIGTLAPHRQASLPDFALLGEQ